MKSTVYLYEKNPTTVSIDFELHYPGDLVIFFTDRSGGTHAPDKENTVTKFITEKEFNRLDKIPGNPEKFRNIAKRIRKKYPEWESYKMTLQIHDSDVIYNF